MTNLGGRVCVREKVKETTAMNIEGMISASNVRTCSNVRNEIFGKLKNDYKPTLPSCLKRKVFNQLVASADLCCRAG